MVMNTLALQTHEFIKELTAAGLTERQAELIANHQAKIIDENLTTKHGSGSVKHEIRLLKHDLELLKKDLIINLGAIIVIGHIVFTSIILGVLPLMLN